MKQWNYASEQLTSGSLSTSPQRRRNIPQVRFVPVLPIVAQSSPAYILAVDKESDLLPTVIDSQKANQNCRTASSPLQKPIVSMHSSPFSAQGMLMDTSTFHWAQQATVPGRIHQKSCQRFYQVSTPLQPWTQQKAMQQRGLIRLQTCWVGGIAIRCNFGGIQLVWHLIYGTKQGRNWSDSSWCQGCQWKEI